VPCAPAGQPVWGHESHLSHEWNTIAVVTSLFFFSTLSPYATVVKQRPMPLLSLRGHSLPWFPVQAPGWLTKPDCKEFQ